MFYPLGVQISSVVEARCRHVALYNALENAARNIKVQLSWMLMNIAPVKVAIMLNCNPFAIPWNPSGTRSLPSSSCVLLRQKNI